jgi:hypothetical protein
MKAKSNRVDSVIVINVPKLGCLTSSLRQIIDGFKLDKALFLQKLEGTSKFLGWQTETGSHIIITKELVANQYIYQADSVVIIKGPSDAGNQCLSIHCKIRHEEEWAEIE